MLSYTHAHPPSTSTTYHAYGKYNSTPTTDADDEASEQAAGWDGLYPTDCGTVTATAARNVVGVPECGNIFGSGRSQPPSNTT
jgi:hypothetical protein